MRKRRNILVALFVVYSLFNNNLPLCYALQDNDAGRDHLFASAPEAASYRHSIPSLERLLSGIAQGRLNAENNSYACFSLCIAELFVQTCTDSPDYSANDIRNIYRPLKQPAADTLSHTEALKPYEGFLFFNSDLSPPLSHVA